MHHYKESGLPYVYLVNGYREVDTPHGKGIAIEDVEGLHLSIAHAAVTERKHLTGPEVRFIRKVVGLTQAQLGELVGVEDQTVRLWEKQSRVPKNADRAIRLLFLNMVNGHAKRPKIADIVTATASRPEVSKISLRFKPRARHEKWGQEVIAA